LNIKKKYNPTSDDTLDVIQEALEICYGEDTNDNEEETCNDMNNQDDNEAYQDRDDTYLDQEVDTWDNEEPSIWTQTHHLHKS